MSITVYDRKIGICVILLLCVLVSPVYAAGDAYTLEDLQTLDKQGKYVEIVKHMNDIRPSQRNEDWASIVHRAVLSTLQQQLQNGDFYAALGLAEGMLETDSSWQDDMQFMALRGQAVINESTACYRNTYYGSECTERLTRLVNESPNDRDLAFKAGKLARIQANSSAAVPFFLLALKDNDNTEGCADEDVLLAVKSGMGLPPKNAALARELGFSTCFNELKTSLVEDFYNSSGYAVNNYCTAFGEKKMLSEFQRAYCLDRQ